MSDHLRHYYLQTMGIVPMILRRTNLNKNNLAALGEVVSTCVRCPLHENRKQTVFSRGNITPKLMIIGDGPGIEDERQGFPMMGKAGALLTKMLSSINFSEADVYITNIVKCRASNGLFPNAEVVSQCFGYLSQQIALVEPQLILVVGLVAAQFLLNSAGSLTTMRGQIHHFQAIPFLVSYHPDELLLHPANKKAAYDDLLMLKQLLLGIGEKT